MAASPDTGGMPTLFAGHGNPLNAIGSGAWSGAFAALSGGLPTPRAIVSISAHWYLAGTFATGNDAPPTIHDFSGFPKALYEVRYPAPGDPGLAERVVELLGLPPSAVRHDWGLDHGTWSVLVNAYPEARIPVVQLSIDHRLAPREHARLGARLAPLRDDGILVFGSGNVTHNLRDAFTRAQTGGTAPPDWALRFDDGVTNATRAHDLEALVTLLEGPDGPRAHPTPDHFLPLLYCMGAARPSDPVSFPIEGWDMGSLSMRAIRFG